MLPNSIDIEEITHDSAHIVHLTWAAAHFITFNMSLSLVSHFQEKTISHIYILYAWKMSWLVFVVNWLVCLHNIIWDKAITIMRYVYIFSLKNFMWTHQHKRKLSKVCALFMLETHCVLHIYICILNSNKRCMYYLDFHCLWWVLEPTLIHEEVLSCCHVQGPV